MALIAALAACAQRAILPIPAVPALATAPELPPAEPAPIYAASAVLPPPAESEEGPDALAVNPATWAEPAPAEVGREFKPIYFDFDSADLRYDARVPLSDYAEWLAKRPDVWLALEGNCDSSGSAEYNYSLGMARSQAVRQHLAGLGVERRRMFPISYGEERPAVLEDGEESMATNRRVEFRAFVAPRGVVAPPAAGTPEPPPEPAQPSSAPPESTEMP